ncbi:MAG: contractile injection system protein, VgrG/Pvc8 family [Chthoniobacteraceae bacterium]
MPERPLSDLALYAAHPTIRFNGAERERATGLLLAMDLVEHEDGLSALELRFSNVANVRDGGSELAFEDEASFKLGDRLAVYAGVESGPTEIFSGVITGLEADFPEAGSPTLTALAEDRLQQARMNRRTRTYENTSLADIARGIAGDLGLTPRVTGFDSPLPVEVQMNESDLAFLRRLLARYDGDVQVVGGELHVSPRGEVRRGEVELALHSQLLRATVLADLAHQVNEVTVTGWDPARGARVTRHSTGAHRGPGRGRVGADLLPDALTRRSHQIGHLAAATDGEAGAIADAAFDERQRRFVTVDGTAEGNPAVRVGTHVTLTGLGARFSNTYYVTRCRHRYDLAHGYETDFTAECAFFGNP